MTDLENKLLKESEGQLFVHIWLSHFGETYWLRSDYYAVKNGFIYLVNGDKEQLSTDNIMDLKTQCVHVDEYIAGTKYNGASKEFSYFELKKLLK